MLENIGIKNIKIEKFILFDYRARLYHRTYIYKYC